ncbi:DUF5643 domain-containing protein [Sutcliffiella halmapala]|uniref:DUF5643 domain-containing protein n=1 Tax=Sutcliffiella halmapala TaxID=79882 RepID=UPI002E26175C
MRCSDLKLVDDRGDVWEPIQSGTISMGSGDDYTLFFQSNYFRKPKELYLVGNSVRAIHKNEQEVVIDLQKDQLTKAPNDGRIQLEQVLREGDNIQFDFLIQMAERDRDHLYEIFDTDPVNLNQDENRAQVGMARSDEETPIIRIFYTIKYPTNMKELKLKITDYPHRIAEPFKVKIK